MPSSRSARARAAVERAAAPGYSTCFCCQRPWRFVKHHSTNYTETNGCFPLCEGCWTALETPERRLPYYEMLRDDWLGGLSDYSPPGRVAAAQRIIEDWPKIEAAVRAGG